MPILIGTMQEGGRSLLTVDLDETVGFHPVRYLQLREAESKLLLPVKKTETSDHIRLIYDLSGKQSWSDWIKLKTGQAEVQEAFFQSLAATIRLLETWGMGAELLVLRADAIAVDPDGTNPAFAVIPARVGCFDPVSILDEFVKNWHGMKDLTFSAAAWFDRLPVSADGRTEGTIFRQPYAGHSSALRQDVGHSSALRQDVGHSSALPQDAGRTDAGQPRADQPYDSLPGQWKDSLTGLLTVAYSGQKPVLPEPSVSVNQSNARLRCRFPDGKAADINLPRNGKHEIGRDPACVIRLGSMTVSQHHAWIEAKDGNWLVSDQRSRNGTWHNGKKVKPHSPVRLRNRDLIRFADVVCVFDSGDQLP